MLPASAVNAVEAPASCRKRRRLTSGMGEVPLVLTYQTPSDDGIRAERVFQEQQTSGKGWVASV
ncbi:hypothetical protein GCM10018980_33250 [Streptomyces capoamus]|uniref:Uncharacterized protein n=1 Tax=Streptomyces capoamus TaxID=68183 RepID=A0A919C4I0_9ACTN|nr:hypothetical protein GCM10010501_03900 [Streptomyces libani subsp. rufus]GHG51092.1 hypothetical protein GCM10018980_33250 [Streptomyces capoamus]